MKILSQNEIESKLKALPLEWSVIGGTSLVRAYAFEDFVQAAAFGVRIGRVAQKQGHYPHLAITQDEVVVTLTTHPEGGLTVFDFNLALDIEGQKD